MSAAEAPGEIIMATGSPGATRNRTKTTTATPASVTRAMLPRRRAPPIIQGWHGACPSTLSDQARLKRPGAVGLHLQRRLKHDRLVVLHERQHVTLFVDVLVNLLPAGN